MSLLLLGLAALGLAAVLFRVVAKPGGAVGRLLPCLLATLPAAIFLASTSSTVPTALRATLVGFGFRGEAARTITIGGDQEKHDVYVGALGSDELLGSLVTASGSAGPPTFVPGGALDGTAMAGWTMGRGAAIRPLGAVALAPGDRLTAHGETWSVTPGQARSLELPRRVGRLPLLPFELTLLRPRSGMERTFAFPPATDRIGRPSTWLFREPVGWVDESLWVASLDPDLHLESGEETRPLAGLPRPLELPGHLHVLGLPRGEGGGFRDLRSYRVRSGGEGLTLQLDTPEIHVVPVEDLDALSLPSESKQEDRRIPIAFGAWQLAEGSLHFAGVSHRIAAEAGAIVRWGGDENEVVLTPRGRLDISFGQPFWLGGDRRVAVQLDVLEAPRGWVLIVLLLALARAFAARAARLPTPALLVLASLEGLLALRLILAIRVATGPPFVDEALQLAAIAWMFLPWGWILLASDRRQPLSRLGLVGAGLLGSWAWSLALGDRPWVWTALHAGLLVIVGWSRTRTARRVLARWDCARRPAAWPAFGLLALALVAMRIALLWVGFRESLDLGPRFSLSLIHVPMALLVEAAYLAWLAGRRREEPLRSIHLLPGLLILGALWVLPGLAVSDLGLTVLGIPAFLIAWIVVVSPAARGLESAWRRPAALPIWLFVGWVLVAGSPIAARAFVVLLPESAEVELRSERNYLRLLGFADPERLDQVARRTSEEVAVMSRVMRASTRGPWTGRGWRESEISPHIEATALREHVPAVFVAAGWGVAGTLGLVALYGVLLVGGEGLRDPGTSPRPMAGALARLGVLGLTVPSIFMVLANHGLVPFTGKNAYLLGLDSTSDILEALVLLILAGLGASWEEG